MLVPHYAASVEVAVVVVDKLRVLAVVAVRQGQVDFLAVGVGQLELAAPLTRAGVEGGKSASSFFNNVGMPL